MYCGILRGIMYYIYLVCHFFGLQNKNISIIMRITHHFVDSTGNKPFSNLLKFTISMYIVISYTTGTTVSLLVTLSEASSMACGTNSKPQVEITWSVIYAYLSLFNLI